MTETGLGAEDIASVGLGDGGLTILGLGITGIRAGVF